MLKVMDNIRFQESTYLELLKPMTEASGSHWKVVMIRVGWSLNERHYSANVLRQMAPMCEGAKAYTTRHGQTFDHIPEKDTKAHPQGFAENLIGWHENVRYETFTDRNGKKGEGLTSDFHVMEGARWLRENLTDAWSHKRQDLLGFSINATGEAKPGFIDGRQGMIVERVDSVQSVDVVTEPAAGGAVLKLVASIDIQEKTQLGDFIRSTMESKDISVERLASAAGISPSTMNQIIRGTIFRPPDQRLRGIARVLGVSFERLLNMIPKGIRENYDLHEMMKQKNSLWFEGHGLPGEDGPHRDYLLGVVEAAITHAQDEQLETDAEKNGTLFQEVARGVNTLNSLARLIRGGKMDEALELISNWTSVHPQKESAGGNNLYSLTYSTKESEEDKKMDNELTEQEKKDEEKKKKAEEEMAARLAALAKRESSLRVKEKAVGSSLPKQAQDRVIALLDGQEDLTDEQIEEALTKERDYIASFSESGKVKDLGDSHDDGKSGKQAEITQDQHTKWKHAFTGLWEGNGSQVEGVTPFWSLKEAFLTINQPKRHLNDMFLARQIFNSIRAAFPGDEFTGMDEHLRYIKESWSGVAGQYRLTEATNQSTFSVLFGDSINIFLQKLTAQDDRNDYKSVVSQNLNSRDFDNVLRLVRTGGFNDLPVVGEGAAYQEITPTRTEVEEQITPQKRGGLEKITLEAILADRMNEIRRIPRALAFADVRTVSKDVWNQIESNPTVSGNALISAGNSNLIGASPALSYSAINDGIELLRNQTEQDSGEKMGLRAKWLLTGVKLHDEAFEFVQSDVKASGAEDSTLSNFIKSQGIGVLSSVGLGRTATTDDHWWLIADQSQTDMIGAGWLGGKMTPDIFVQSPSDTPTQGEAFTADVMTIKIRSNYVGSANFDHRYIVGSLA